MVSVATTQLCHCSAKATMDVVQTNEHGYVPITLKMGSRHGWAPGLSVAKL